MPRERSRRIDELDLPRQLDDSRPKGDQIREILEDLADRIGPGAALPSDRHLAAHFGVARMTVRNEITQLTTAGVLDVQHGRGTYVAETPRRSHEWGASYSLSATAVDGNPGARLLGRAVVEVDDTLAHLLDVPLGGRALTVERLRTLDGEPVGIERVALPLDRFPGLEEVDLERQSLYRVLDERWGLQRVAANGTATAVLPSAADAALLEIAPSSPCVLVNMVNRDGTGLVFETGRSIYRGDRYEIAVNYGARLSTA